LGEKYRHANGITAKNVKQIEIQQDANSSDSGSSSFNNASDDLGISELV
jgi:hypothetical protein